MLLIVIFDAVIFLFFAFMVIECISDALRKRLT